MAKLYFTYDSIHELIAKSVYKAKEFEPDVIIAIGGGGFIAGRIVRTFLKVPLLSVTVKLYNDVTSDTNSSEPTILQWLDEKNISWIKGKRVLIVDEIDDTRVTMGFVCQKMVEHGVSAIGTFVIHNKLRPKHGVLPNGAVHMSCEEVANVWIVYPWENEMKSTTVD